MILANERWQCGHGSLPVDWHIIDSLALPPILLFCRMRGMARLKEEYLIRYIDFLDAECGRKLAVPPTNPSVPTMRVS